MQGYKLIFLLGTLGLTLAVSACDVTTPSAINTSKLVVKDKIVTETLSADRVDLKRVAAIARTVARNGNGEIDLTIPYAQGGAVKAGEMGASYKNAFAAQGATHVSVSLVAMTDGHEASRVVASYQAQVAQQAKDCGRLPGYQGGQDMANYGDYQFGCETQAHLAKMINDPSDLLGKETTGEANSRRNGAIIEPYMLGTPNEPIQGMSASTVGAQ